MEGEYGGAGRELKKYFRRLINLYIMRYRFLYIVIFLSGFLISCYSSKPEKKVITFPHERGGIKFSEQHISFGKVLAGEPVQDTLYLYNPTEKTVECRFQDRADWIRVIPEHLYIQSGDTVRVYVRLLTGRCDKYGKFQQQIGFLSHLSGTSWNPPLLVSGEVLENFSGLTEEEKEMAPKITLDATEYDFGDLQQEQQVAHVFRIANEGKRDLIIRRIEATCGCTAVVPESRVIRPGESKELKVTFHTADRHGKQLKTIHVISNDYRRPSTILRIKANVINEKDQ